MTEVTRGEFDMLRAMVADQGNRIMSLDEHGTKGVIVVQAQLAEVIKELAELKADFKAEKTARTLTRRWILGLAVAATGAVAGLTTALIETLAHLHG